MPVTFPARVYMAFLRAGVLFLDPEQGRIDVAVWSMTFLTALRQEGTFLGVGCRQP